MAGLTAERPDPLRWIAAPMALCMAATLLLAAPIKLWGLQLPEPVFAMIPAFAWAVLRPQILAPACLLILGLFDDLIWGGRLGLWGLGLLVAYGIVLVSRNMMSGQSRLMMGVWYITAWTACMATAWTVTAMQTANSPSLIALALQWLPTALLFPVADYLVARFEDADPRFR
jgi:rod shape-determining protein MreD